MNKLNGFFYGLLLLVFFGFIFFFMIFVMCEGMNFEFILFYWFLFVCLVLGCILLLDKQFFYIKWKEILLLMLFVFLYLMFVVFLFWGYKFMVSGVVIIIYFMYLVLIILIMMIFFCERKLMWCFFVIVFVVVGVFCFFYGDSLGGIIVFGLFIVFLLVLGYVFYLVMVSQFKIGQMKGLWFIFYVFLFGMFLLLVGIGIIIGI